MLILHDFVAGYESQRAIGKSAGSTYLETSGNATPREKPKVSRRVHLNNTRPIPLEGEATAAASAAGAEGEGEGRGIYVKIKN